MSALIKACIVGFDVAAESSEESPKGSTPLLAFDCLVNEIRDILFFITNKFQGCIVHSVNNFMPPFKFSALAELFVGDR